VKLSPGRFSFISASYTTSWTAMFREDIHMHMHMSHLIEAAMQWDARHDGIAKGDLPAGDGGDLERPRRGGGLRQGGFKEPGHRPSRDPVERV